jgi:hypothetical protein
MRSTTTNASRHDARPARLEKATCGGTRDATNATS